MDSQPLLFIDAYDSFSNNIISLLESELRVRVIKIYIDAVIPHFPQFLRKFCGIVLGPGPGTAKNPEDVGIVNEIWRLSDSHLLPVFGICLGFQSLVFNFGGVIRRLHNPRHGQETTIVSRGTSIFAGLESFRAIQYHSLHASLGHQEQRQGDVSEQDIWQPGPLTNELIPLAWDFGDLCPLHRKHQDCQECSSQKNPRSILMAVRHCRKPFYAVQFHPESICSSPEARRVLQNWWLLVKPWRKCFKSMNSARNSLGDQNRGSAQAQPQKAPSLTSDPREKCPEPASNILPLPNGITPSSLCLDYREIQLDDLDVLSICIKLGICFYERDDVVILDSAKRQPGLGMNSIIGLVDSSTVKISYSVGAHFVEIQKGDEKTVESLGPYGDTIFDYLREFMQQCQLQKAPECQDCPFWGGLVGYIDYEACLETIRVAPSLPRRARANVSFAYIQRSVVIAHDQNRLFINSTKPNDRDWIEHTVTTLQNEPVHTNRVSPSEPRTSVPCSPNFDYPEESSYHAKIRACQQELGAGNSYELCLTDQTLVHLKPRVPISSWKRHQRLRSINAAPFAAYFRLGSLTLLGSSPERFLFWSRPRLMPSDESDEPLLVSTCQFRPIKGTVKKYVSTRAGDIRRVSLEEAVAKLSTPKERAENLMIVDLIRHDLSGIIGGRNVYIPSLMSVEEYETAYQLVTVIEGCLNQPMPPSSHGVERNRKLMSESSASSQLREGRKTGIDLLAASLPPGSMTGAPKKRSCELLNKIEEHQPRSVYSGVLGYMDIGGRGDFAVVIRTAFKWADEQPHDDGEVWRIGAGGAITVLSTEEGEWEEMMTKLSSVVGLFKDG